jgi:hypothetical protein
MQVATGLAVVCVCKCLQAPANVRNTLPHMICLLTQCVANDRTTTVRALSVVVCSLSIYYHMFAMSLIILTAQDMR